MRFVLCTLLLVAPSSTFAQSSDPEVQVRPASEIPEDMPEAPENAPPAEAPAVGEGDDRPPHPQMPAPLEEAQPSPETLAKTVYHWLPGHWTWTGEQYEWTSGEWIYAVQDMILVPPRWEWDGKQWLFHDAGWAKPGTETALYRPTPAPGALEATQNDEQPPADSNEPEQPRKAQVTVYLWTGVYSTPLIVYPRWHPHYHYHWYHRHPYYRAAPAYRDQRYHYAKTHHYAHPHGNRPPQQPTNRPSQPSSKPSQPSTRPPDKASAQRKQQRSYGGTRRSRSGRRR